MNDFLEQFLVESRELIEQATHDLLALEERPQDVERLDSAFRAFHTLKGAAGIMEFQPMGRALHAAEDVLSSAQAGRIKVGPALVSDCLTCLDQVTQWLEDWESSGAPPAGADAQAEILLRRFEGAASAAPITPLPDDVSWADAFAARRLPAGAAAALAVRYTPPRDSFFQGLDPLALFEDLPGLVGLEIEPVDGWPPLESLDPFACEARILALFSEDGAVLRGQFEALEGSVQFVRLAEGAPGARAELSAMAADLVQAQIQMLRASAGEGLVGRTLSAARVAESVIRRNAPEEADRIEQLARSNPEDPDGLATALEDLLAGRPGARPRAGASDHAPPDAALRGLRVDVDRVDALVKLAGELTVAKNALSHASAMAAAGTDPEALSRLLKDQHAQLDRLVGDLQSAVLNLRVLPVRHVFQRFPRLVREMVVALDKPARLVTEGDATEADKAVVENLFEPLLHVLRNALDHGVETAEERAAAGKPPSATIHLRARRDGAQVVVEVQDDGRGVDVGRVREVALRRGLVAPDVLEAMSDDEVTDLIFAPGFSTATDVTAVSGRGVGMDAVRSAIERLGGHVAVHSEPGDGALVRFTLPFTVMMSRVMTVEVGGQMFGIPLETVLETVRLPRERIVAVGGARAFVLRDRTIPLIDLRETLGQAPGDSTSDVDVVVATASGRLGGVEVDRLGERMDVMLKPLDGLLSGSPGVAGATLLGDGRVLLVLDLPELLR